MMRVLPRLPLSLRLGLLVAITLLPLALLAAVLNYWTYETNKDLASERLSQIARSFMGTVDARMTAIENSLEVLSLSEELGRDDVQAFRAKAEVFKDRYLPGTNILLIDRTGAQLINTAIPATAELPRRTINAEQIAAQQRVFGSGQATVSNLFRPERASSFFVTVNVPVRRGNEIVYCLAAGIPSATLTQFIAGQTTDPNWTVALFDGNKAVIARSRDAERFVGQRTVRSVYKALEARSGTVFRSVTLDKITVVTATAHSGISNWSLAVGVPESTFDQPLQNSMALLGGISVLCLVFGTIMAARQASRLSRAERHQELLINELDHRVKNTLATVQSITRRTLRASDSVEDAAAALESRIVALARAYDLLRAERWKGANLADLIRRILAPYVTSPEEHIQADGPNVRLSSRAALALAMVFNELATNAAKYGALSRPGGKVIVKWDREAADTGSTRILWAEAGGPEVAASSSRSGFGTSLIERTIRDDLGGSYEVRREPTGLRCRIEVPTRSLAG